MLRDVGTGEQQQVAQLRASRYVWTKLSWDLGKATGMDQVSRVSGFRPWQHLTQPKRFCLTEDTSARGQRVGDVSPECRVGEWVRGQVAGMIVGSSGGWVQAKRRQGGHA